MALTPRMYDALCRRADAKTEHSEFMLAQIAAAVVNFSPHPPKDSLSPTVFMPSRAKAEQEHSDAAQMLTSLVSSLSAKGMLKNV